MLDPRRLGPGRRIDVAEPFQHFIDDYLGYLYEAHPTSATLDGNHVHDDLLDDLSRTAIDSHAGALAGFARRLQAIPTDGLGPVDQVEHRIVRANIESRQFEVERGPVLGARPALLRPDAGGQPGAPGPVHLRVGDRPRPPRALEAAPGAAAGPGGPRQRQGSAGDLRQDRHRHLPRRGHLHRRRPAAGLRRHRRHAPAGRPGRRLDRGDAGAVGATPSGSRPRCGREAKASFRLGRERFERKLELDEGLSYSCERLLLIAERELARRRRRSARWPDGSTAATRWKRGARPRTRTPPPAR